MKKFIEPALAIGLIFALIIGARADVRQGEIAKKMLRIHVIANSDSAADQAEKLRVRDEVLQYTNIIFDGAQNLNNAKEIAQRNLAGISRVASNATDYPVSVELCKMPFPTREYDTFSLPAGEYDALRVIIGEGTGRNWWCVMFPPLCVTAAEVVSSASEAGLTEAELDMIASGEPVYKYEFKFLEILSKIKQKLI